MKPAPSHTLLLCGLALCAGLFSECATTTKQRIWGTNGASSGNSASTGAEIVSIAKNYLGTPYRYGGVTPAGFDCSGFVGYVYKKAGFRVPRDARDQYRVLHPLQSPKPGDLVFFKISGTSISHVGIYTGNLKFIHSPRTGKTVEIADMRNPYWKKVYAGARTIFF